MSSAADACKPADFAGGHEIGMHYTAPLSLMLSAANTVMAAFMSAAPTAQRRMLILLLAAKHLRALPRFSSADTHLRWPNIIKRRSADSERIGAIISSTSVCRMPWRARRCRRRGRARLSSSATAAGRQNDGDGDLLRGVEKHEPAHGRAS